MRNQTLILGIIFMFCVAKNKAQNNTLEYDAPSKCSIENSWKERYRDAQISKGDPCLFCGMGYAYNRSYKTHGDFCIGTYFPVTNIFETELGIGILTTNTFSFSCVLRQRLPIPVGEFFLEERLLDKIMETDGINDFSWNLVFGYRLKHVSLGLGFSYRTVSLLSKDYANKYDFISEPNNFTYRLEYFVRPQMSSWNISLAITNYDRFLVERFVQPFFELNGYCKVTPKTSLFLDTRLEQSGMTALSCEFYGVNTCLGIVYKF